MLETVTILLVAASIFGYLNFRIFKLPFAIAMLVAGLLASLFVLTFDAYLPSYQLGQELREFALQEVDFSEALMRGMLSFLLFAGALHTDMKVLAKWSKAIFSLATVGVAISTVVIGVLSFGTFILLDLNVPFLWCLVFGALISPTDPVAVLGIMKAAGAPKQVETKVVGESLFNDGVGVVLFTLLVSIAIGGDTNLEAIEVVKLILLEVIGGMGLGLIAGWITYLALKDLDEPNLETLITVAMVMGVSGLAFSLHASAPLACVVAGLFIGNKGREDAMSQDTADAVDTVWSFIDEALNAVLFLLVGLEVVAFDFDKSYLVAAILLIGVALFGRFLAVMIPMTLFKAVTEMLPGTRRILIWGGIKGGISIALALSLPQFEGRDVILTVTYAIVVVSILVQGLTVGRLIQQVKEPDVPDEAAW